MLFDVHLYSGTVLISEKSNTKYQIGDKHAFLLYVRADLNAEYNQGNAEEIIFDLGFEEIEFSRAGKVSPEKAAVSHNKIYYDNAVKSGASFVLYSDPI
ncbi:hypothetical protein SAMN05428975_1054 [Mucilaginibacter sp. OK268]|uniref:hypothetical protein n=1 Tax=Mucilaginibacter sp. OK268 TaxID=1881048 RepID=UPI00088D51E3|nr:hypothetical protein [Mucilaginibacter sp. OK268]SDP29986.1 hypothetical protein SAMN05428975_1054 [Mucilaginibacter sp. OK268]